MVDQSSIFPAFIRAEYDGSGSGFALFEKEAGESAARARRQFEANFAEVERVVSGAMSRGLKTSGAMDLGVDGYRQAAANAKVYEMSLRNTRDAAQALAVSTGDTSSATHSYVQALSAQVNEAVRARQEADAQVVTYSRLQAGVDALASRNSALSASYRELYAEQARAARDEVRSRRAQEGYEGVFAPGLSRSATNDGAGFEALEQMAVRSTAAVRDLELAIGGALSRGRSIGGSLDLGVGQYRQAAAEARAYEGTLAALRDAAGQTARETGDTSAATRDYLHVLDAQIIEAERAREAAESQVAVYSRLQTTLDATAARNGALAASYRELYAEQARSARYGAADSLYARGTQTAVNAAVAPAIDRSALDAGAGFQALEAMAQRSEAAVRDLEGAIASAFSRSLSASGSLDLGLSQFRQAAAEARVYEATLTAAQQSTIRLAQETGDTSAATRDYINVLDAQVLEAGRAREAAEAQVTTYARLQQELDATAARNTALTATYRELYAEQARAAQEEVRGRRSNAAYDDVLGVNRPAATSNGASFDALDEQARNMERYGKAAADLRNELDPMYAAQQRFNQALDTADDLLKANIIDERLHAAVVQNARDQLQAHSSAIHSQNDGYTQLVRGSGVLRQAYIQTGQQLQDVTVSLIGGQKASVVLAQQLPQLAFALSGLGMQADGTQKGIGRIAALLAGPWGVAFMGASFAVGLLIEKLMQQDEVSKEAKKATEEHTRAVEALNEAAERSIQTAEGRARAAFIEIDIERQAAAATRDRTKALLEQAKLAAERKRDDVKVSARGDLINPGFVAAAAEVERLTGLLKTNQEALDRLSRNTIINRGTYIASITDQLQTAEGRANRRFDIERNTLIGKGGSDDEVAQGLARIETARKAEIERIRETEKALNSSGSSREREAATVNQVSKVLLQHFGGTITSTTGGQHVKGSYHYRGQAVDFVPKGGMGSVTKEQIRAVAQAAGLQIKELLGPGDKGHNDHFHLAWSGGKNEISSSRMQERLDAEKERNDEQKRRAAEELERSVEALFSRLDAGKAPMIEYGNTIDEINRLFAAGAIDADQRFSLQLKAANDNAAQMSRVNEAAMEELSKALGGTMRAEVEKFNAEQEAALKRQADLARQAQIAIDNGLTQIADFFGNDVARILDQMSARLGPDSELNQMLGGIGKGKSKMWDGLGEQVSGALKKSGINAEGLGQSIGQVMAGAQMGRLFGKGFTDLFGIKGSKLGSEIGGAIGSAIGGPIGAVVGGTIGSITGGLFKTAKWGTAVVTGNSDNDVSVGGNKSAYRSNASLAGTSIQTGLDQIAEQFGVDVGGYNVSIGQYKGKWRVSTTGRTGKLKGGSGRTDIKDFGEDGAEDAIKYAIADAVKDGALQGLRASTQALLAASDDVEAQLQKALDFEDVFSRLKSYKDPVGAAVDTIDKEFKRLEKIFEEAGATTEEYAQLEELYGIERAAAVKEAAEKVTASLKSLFDDLTVGNDARSLKDRMLEAQANYDPLAQRVAAGDTTAYDDYADAAQQMLEIQRQIYGSGEEYFKMLDEITALTKTRIDAEANIASISEARPSLFASDTSLAPVVSATESSAAVIVAALKSVSTEQTASNIAALNLIQTTLAQISAKLAGTSEKSNNLGTVSRSNF